MSDDDPDAEVGASRLIRLNWQVTVLFAAASIATDRFAERLDLAYAVASSVLFAAGIGLFLLGFWNGVQRSRIELVSLPGLMAVSSSHVPARWRNRLWGAVLVQVVVAVTAASVRPFTQQAFGLLVPMFGIGLAALFGSRYGKFFPRNGS